ncbi:hypothetical protein [Kineothrix sp. MB12-C1]|uniref:hypothetical protein n=1 Tax=Kineothrix sp. MB12-C1 TaxID=3070215 RepID=UPI0027D2841A|nr:hypothetical protein [Kineothrix sp. MB12-C1]WMC91310.1 hypothetical protein RBB56_10490 [Kineothrix sp. MB12-C1]
MENTKLKQQLTSKRKASTAPAEERTLVKMPETDFPPVHSDYIAFSNPVLDILRENLKNQPLSFSLFDLVKSPSGGAVVFSVPGLTGEEAEKELTGIILGYITPRAYWDTPDPVEGTPPVCSSPDSMVSYDGKPCSQCPFNDFGSKNGESNAKACKESVLLFLLRPSNILPLLVRIPVSSKMLFLKYTTRLVSNLTPLNSVVTKISLEKATSRDGKPYAKYQFESDRTLSAEEAVHAKEFGKQFLEIFNTVEIDIEPMIQEAG